MLSYVMVRKRIAGPLHFEKGADIVIFLADDGWHVIVRKEADRPSFSDFGRFEEANKLRGTLVQRNRDYLWVPDNPAFSLPIMLTASPDYLPFKSD